MDRIYDVIVIGGGPSGCTAALYAARAGLDTLVLEKMAPGGQMTQTSHIDNYPGYDQGIDGYALGEKMQAQAERFGAGTKLAEVYQADLSGDVKRLETSEGDFLGKTVVISTGASHRHLGVDREEQMIGRGVAYCAACDGMFYRGKTVAVVGGGNTAASDALLLSRICEKVILIHRRDTLRATKIYQDQLMNTPNVEFRWNHAVNRLLGEEQISGLELRNVMTGDLSQLSVDGVFVSIGQSPVTQLFQGQIDLDEGGYIVADESTRTNLPGVFAAGDVRTKALRQIITAAADGAAAAHYAEEYLSQTGSI